MRKSMNSCLICLVLINLTSIIIIIVMLSKSVSKLIRPFCSSHTIEPAFQPYLTLRKQDFEKYMQQTSNLTIEGSYCPQGAQSYSKKHKEVFMKNWVSDKQFKASNIGVGTYKGSLNQIDDILQFNGIVDSVMLGANVIDTCSNFRGGRSELVVGSALRYLTQVKNYQRNQLMISSKAGYVREDLPVHIGQEIVNEHCVHPLYLEQSLGKSLEAMKVQTLDVFYINNFAEAQLQKIGKDRFYEKLHRAFEFCQKSRSEKKIQFYGLASWQSFRLSPSNPLHLNLKTVCSIAEKVGGPHNGFKFLQTPINIMMPQAFAEKNQQFGSLLETAEALKINLVSCSPILNGTLINVPLPTNKLSCRNNGAKHLQLIRSVPSPALVCSLIGQKTNRHVKKNMQVIRVPLLTEEEWFNIFVPQQVPNQVPQ